MGASFGAFLYFGASEGRCPFGVGMIGLGTIGLRVIGVGWGVVRGYRRRVDRNTQISYYR